MKRWHAARYPLISRNVQRIQERLHHSLHVIVVRLFLFLPPMGSSNIPAENDGRAPIFVAALVILEKNAADFKKLHPWIVPVKIELGIFQKRWKQACPQNGLILRKGVGDWYRYGILLL